MTETPVFQAIAGRLIITSPGESTFLSASDIYGAVIEAPSTLRIESVPPVPHWFFSYPSPEAAQAALEDATSAILNASRWRSP